MNAPNEALSLLRPRRSLHAAVVALVWICALSIPACSEETEISDPDPDPEPPTLVAEGFRVELDVEGGTFDVIRDDDQAAITGAFAEVGVLDPESGD